MGRYIMKADKDHDLYVEWSTVVDAPVGWGPAASFSSLDVGRKARCDETGTSMHDPQWGGWEDDGMIVHNLGNRHGFYWLERDKLYAFMSALGGYAEAEDPDHQQAALDAHTKDITEDED